jgi:chromosomal replication initiator protein
MEQKNFWQYCLLSMQTNPSISQTHFNQWLSPLQARLRDNEVSIFAPNKYILSEAKERFEQEIKQSILQTLQLHDVKLVWFIGDVQTWDDIGGCESNPKANLPASAGGNIQIEWKLSSNLHHLLNFGNFVEGKSNQLALAAARQVAGTPGGAYNPFVIYGASGLGKTHLMHAVGNALLEANPKARVVYLTSEAFVASMVHALRNNAINEFKKMYRMVDALLIDDIQFFAGKERSQEEFFHTFNTLLEGQKQIILTSDRYPKEIDGIEGRLLSRFGAGLTVAVQPPELETRVAILINKARFYDIDLPYDVAFFVAQRVRSNVRELEGALKRIVATHRFTKEAITLLFVQQVLKDLWVIQEKQVSLDNIIRTVAGYYKRQASELLSGSRHQSLVRPRQVAMRLCKELTQHSLSEIGRAFGRDHTTVLYACRKIDAQRHQDLKLDETLLHLVRVLSA